MGIAGAALVFFLFATAIDIGVLKVVGSPEPIKKILSDSGIYNSVVSSSLDQAKQINGSTNEISLTDPIVRSTAESTFSPQFLQTTTNSVIDSVYKWLNGQTTVPDFKIDLSAQKAVFAEKVAQGAEQRAAGLPRCTTLPDLNNYDALNATCLPPRLTPAQAAATIRNDVFSGEGFLNNPVIDASSVKSANSDQSIFVDQLKSAPSDYRKIKATPFVFGLISLLSLLAVIFLSSSWQRGLRHAGFVLLVIGIFLVLFSLSVNSVVNKKLVPKINMTNAVLQTDVRKLVHESAQNVDNTFLLFGIGYAILGSLCVGGYYLMSKRTHPAPDNAPGDKPENPSTQKEPAEDTPVPKKKSKTQ